MVNTSVGCDGALGGAAAAAGSVHESARQLGKGWRMRVMMCEDYPKQLYLLMLSSAEAFDSSQWLGSSEPVHWFVQRLFVLGFDFRR